MRINQREGDWERSNLSFLALGFPFFFLFVIGASGFREEKRVWKKKGDEKQNNTIRMLLDSFVLVVDFFFFSFFLLKCAHCGGEERAQFHRIPHEISRGSTCF